MPYLFSDKEIIEIKIRTHLNAKQVAEAFIDEFFSVDYDVEPVLQKDGSYRISGKYIVEKIKVKLDLSFFDFKKRVIVKGQIRNFATTFFWFVGLALVPVGGIGFIWLGAFYLLDASRLKWEIVSPINILQAMEEAIDSGRYDDIDKAVVTDEEALKEVEKTEVATKEKKPVNWKAVFFKLLTVLIWLFSLSLLIFAYVSYVEGQVSMVFFFLSMGVLWMPVTTKLMQRFIQKGSPYLYKAIFTGICFIFMIAMI